MAESKLTLIGFYNYMKSINDDLFKNLDLPEGIDNEVVIDNILLRGGEFEVIYSDPFFLQGAIKPWCRKWRFTFRKWLETINLKYNPIENYDRYEEWTDTEDGTKSGNRKATNKRDEDIRYSMASSNAGTVDNTTTSTNEVSAYDSSTYQPKDKNTLTIDENTTGNAYEDSGTITTGVDNITDDTTDKHNNKNVHVGHVHGNIGVMSSQDMVLKQWEVARLNLYEQIVDMFLNEFIIPVY